MSLRNFMPKLNSCFFLSLILIAAVLFSAGCQKKIPGLTKADAVISPTGQDQSKVQVPDKVLISISFVGDIMVHSNNLASAYDKTTGAYSFSGVFDEVKEYLGAADITIGNLETTLAGRDRGYTGYPRFNSPEEILPALKDSGIDVLSTANNHSMDSGEYGVHKTIEHLDKAGIKHAGTYTGAESRNLPLIIEVKGVKCGILSYTYGTNGLPVPKGKGYMVNLLDQTLIKEDITRARETGAEVIIVLPHFGIEYRLIPGDQERKLVQSLFDAGADIVAGSHPHVIQPMELRSPKDGEKGMFAAYSLGNFISGQKGRYRDSGVILNLYLEKNLETGEISLASADYVPTWVHKYNDGGKTRFRVLAVDKAIADYSKGMDQKLKPEDYNRLQEVIKETTSMLSRPGGPVKRNI